MAHRGMTTFALLCMAACNDARPTSLNGAADGGAFVSDMGGDGADMGAAPPDSGPTDGGMDAVDLGTPDLGPPPPPVRSMKAPVALIPEPDLENLVLLPDFGPALNGGWLGLPLLPGPLPTVQRRVEFERPTELAEILVLPGTDAVPGGSGVYGTAQGVGTDVRGEVWLGLEDADEAAWSLLTAGLILYVEGMGPSIVFFEGDDRSDVVLGSRTWRRFEGSAGVSVYGRVTFGVQNAGPQPVWINGPRMSSLAAPPGARRPKAQLTPWQPPPGADEVQVRPGPRTRSAWEWIDLPQSPRDDTN